MKSESPRDVATVAASLMQGLRSVVLALAATSSLTAAADRIPRYRARIVQRQDKRGWVGATGYVRPRPKPKMPIRPISSCHGRTK